MNRMPIDALGKPGGPVAVGFDAGSVALKVAVTDLSGEILDSSYTRTQGRPIETAIRVLGEVLERYGDRVVMAAGTGTAGRLICDLLEVPLVNEVICQATAVRRLHPEARTLIEMGGQDSKLIFLPTDPADSRTLVDFTMNTNCAAGTGSFLDQQASRMGIPIEEFGRLALKSTAAPRVAGRCSVFAKSDMIHLQQQATPVHEIIAGLCMGLIRNLKSNLGRGREFARPIAFCGGVAANEGVVRAIREVFELEEGELIVPDCHEVTGALGAVLVAMDGRSDRAGEEISRLAEPFDLSVLRRHLEEAGNRGNRHSPLDAPQERPAEADAVRTDLLAAVNGQPIDAYLGLDVGSISTKVAVIDDENRVLAKIYLMTASRPLEAVRRALREIHSQVGDKIRIRGAATTGSGRYLTGDFIGADLVINEITAQATAAAAIDPEVDTIFEIGGQDSKYIALDRGVVVDFEMNHACAAGTGSFLEEQAERLGINIKRQFASCAMASQGPIRLGERCTVFMESDLLSHQQQGAGTDDLVAGLCYSIVSNYINRVVGHRRIGQRIFFQGGTAFNRGVVAAFEKVTGCRITVPPHHEVTGAMGAAILARRHQRQLGRNESNFGGFELADQQYEVRSFTCDACSNDCEINEVKIPGRDPLYHGSRCDRYNVKKDSKTASSIPNLFAERQKLLLRHANLPETRPGRPTIGIPLALSNYQLLPFWGTLFGQLGLNVTVTPVSTPKIIHRGVETVVSTPCFPVKVAHGHVLELLDKGVDYVWLPSVINLTRDDESARFNQLCPYVTAIPYQVAAAIASEASVARLLTPDVRFQNGPRQLRKDLKPVCKKLGLNAKQLAGAIAKAWKSQQDFEEACRARGREILATLDASTRAMVIISRPYNGCDAGINLAIHDKLRKLDVLAIPMDFLDLRSQEKGDHLFDHMYWKYGQRILRAAKIVRNDPRLNAIYLSNFSCGPDSFLLGYFKRLMAPKPSLVVEIDEHSAAAGLVTRLEAFLESLRAAPPAEVAPLGPLYPKDSSNFRGRKVHVPWMGDQCHAVVAALRSAGLDAQIIPVGGHEIMELGRRYTSGKECLPCIITAGDMIRIVREPGFDPKRTAFFMPGGSGPCRFGQYHCVHKLLLNDLGVPEVPMLSLSQDSELYDQCAELGSDVLMGAWRGTCAADVLLKTLLALRPYETRPGAVQQAYQAWIKRICDRIEAKASQSQLIEEMARAAKEFAALPVDRSQPRPKIGIVGEIYVRFHTDANNNLIGQLEKFGAETVLAGFPEWMYYTNYLRKRQSFDERHFGTWLKSMLKDKVMWKAHRQLHEPFEGLLGPFSEPPMKELLELADPFIHESFQGEAVLSVGKMIELAQHGCHGLINVGPFSCMPSTIVAGVMKKVQNALGAMPSMTISYDGQQDPTLETRLEAFMHQAHAFQAGGSPEHCQSHLPLAGPHSPARHCQHCQAGKGC